MKRVLLALAIAGGLAAPVFAMEPMSADKMSCADYGKLDGAGQMKSMEMMGSDHMAAGGAMAAGGKMSAGHMSTEDMMAAAKAGCTAHPDMMVGDAMKAKM